MRQNVYLLWFHPDEDDGLLIGVYESEPAANAAIERLKGKPGFVNHPQGFKVYSRKLGEDSWTEGFIQD